MNFDKLFAWIVPIVVAAAIAGNLDTLQRWIWKAHANAIDASRTLTWGSPRFFPKQQVIEKTKTRGP